MATVMLRGGIDVVAFSLKVEGWRGLLALDGAGGSGSWCFQESAEQAHVRCRWRRTLGNGV